MSDQKKDKDTTKAKDEATTSKETNNKLELGLLEEHDEFEEFKTEDWKQDDKEGQAGEKDSDLWEKLDMNQPIIEISKDDIPSIIEKYNEILQQIQQRIDDLKKQFESCEEIIDIRIESIKSLVDILCSKDLFDRRSSDLNGQQRPINYHKYLKRVKKRVKLIHKYLYPLNVNNNDEHNTLYDVFAPKFEYGCNVDVKQLRDVLMKNVPSGHSRHLKVICEPNDETGGLAVCRNMFEENYTQFIIKANLFVGFLTEDLLQSDQSKLFIDMLKEAIREQKICVIIMIDVELNTISLDYDNNGHIYTYHFSKSSNFHQFCQILAPIIWRLVTHDRIDLNDQSSVGHILYSEEDHSKSEMLSKFMTLERNLKEDKYDFQTIVEMLENFMSESQIPLEQFNTIETINKLKDFKKKLEEFGKIETTEEFLELKKSFFCKQKKKATEKELQVFGHAHENELDDFVDLLYNNNNVDINACYRGFSLLLWAIFHEKVDIVEYILTHFEVDFDLTDDFDRNCFQLAALYCQGEEIIQLLSKYKHRNKCTYPIVKYFFDEKSIEITKIDTNLKDNYGSTILHYIAARNRIDLLDVLDFTNVDFKAKDKRNRTCFVKASTNGHLDILIKLLEKFNIVLDFNNEESKEILKSIITSTLWRCRKHIVDWWFENVQSIPDKIVDEAFLMSNVISSDPIVYKEMIEYLLEKGGNINHQNDKGNNIIADRVISLHPLSKTQIDLLLEKGINISAVNKKRQSVVHMGAIYGNLDLVKIAYEKYQIPVTEPDADGKTPFMWCSQRGCTHVAKYLLSIDDQYEHLHQVDIFKNDACSLALQNGFEEIVHLLMLRGLKPNFVEGVYKMPIDNEDNHNMIKKLDLCTMKAVGLFEFSSDPIQNGYDTTPLHLCAIAGRNDAIIRLYKNGFDMKCFDKHDNTPLYYAIKYNKLETALLLVALGVSEINRCSINGKILTESFKKDTSIVKIKPESIVIKVYKEAKILCEIFKFYESNAQFFRDIKDKIDQVNENDCQNDKMIERSTIYKNFVKQSHRINYFPNFIKWIKEHNDKYPNKKKRLFQILKERDYCTRACNFIKYYLNRKRLEFLDDNKFLVIVYLFEFTLKHIGEPDFRHMIENSQLVELFLNMKANENNNQQEELENFKIIYTYVRLILFSIKKDKTRVLNNEEDLFETLNDSEFCSTACLFIKSFIRRESLQLLNENKFKVTAYLLDFIFKHTDGHEFRTAIQNNELIELFFCIHLNHEIFSYQESEKVKTIYAYVHLILFTIILKKNLNAVNRTKLICWSSTVFGPYMSSRSSECVIKTMDKRTTIRLCDIICSLKSVIEIKVIYKSFKERSRMDKSCLILLKGHIKEKLALSQFILDLCSNDKFKKALRNNFLLVETLKCINQHSDNELLRQQCERILQQINYTDPWQRILGSSDTSPIQEST